MTLLSRLLPALDLHLLVVTLLLTPMEMVILQLTVVQCFPRALVFKSLFEKVKCAVCLF